MRLDGAESRAIAPTSRSIPSPLVMGPRHPLGRRRGGPAAARRRAFGPPRGLRSVQGGRADTRGFFLAQGQRGLEVDVSGEMMRTARGIRHDADAPGRPLTKDMDLSMVRAEGRPHAPGHGTPVQGTTRDRVDRDGGGGR